MNKMLRHSVMGFAFTTAMTVLNLGPAQAEMDRINLKVVGTWGYLNQWKEVEQPFWTQDVQAASGGAITVDAKPMTDLGLKGFEIMRMLGLGIFDVSHGIISYLGEDTVAEGIDLAGVTQNWEEAQDVVTAYRDVLSVRFQESYQAKLLGIYPFPAQYLYCNTEVSGLADLEGLKIRSYSKSMSDLISGLGATPVTIAFGEVVPALQLGTVDCAVTGNLPAYVSGWGKVSKSMIRLSTGFAFSYVAVSNNTWAKLNDETKAFLLDGVAEMERKAWDVAERDSALGVACLTDGDCTLGEPAGLTDVTLSDADDALRRDVLQSAVLTSYAERCDEACVANWNSTIGQSVGLEIQ